MIFVKRYDTDHGVLIAMCDEELIGRVLKEGKIEMDLEKYASFYRGELMSEADAGKMEISELYSANIVGERAVSIMMKKGIVCKDEVKKLGKVPFVQVYRLDSI